jgi:hypothetical protein
MGTVSAVRQERFEKRYYGRWLATKEMSALLLQYCLKSMKGLSSTNWSPSPWFFFGLGVMNDAAKPDCILPIGDDGSLNGGRSSSKLIVIEINTESEYNSNVHMGMALSIE